MKKQFRPYIAFLAMGSLLIFSACNDDEEPEPDHEHDVITTITLTLTSEGAKDIHTATATWRDTDGPGGDAPQISTLTLRENTTYKGTLQFLDESQTGASHDLTADITEAGTEHEVFYIPAGANITFQKTDLDDRNLPIGLETEAITAGASQGTVRILLKHQPNLKSATSDENTGGTDADVTFPTIIQQ